MRTLHVLMIGHVAALSSRRAQEIKKALLKGQGQESKVQLYTAALPEDLSGPKVYDVWIFFSHAASIPPYAAWTPLAKRNEKTRIAVVGEKAPSQPVLSSLKVEFLLIENESVQDFVEKILGGANADLSPQHLTNRQITASSTQMEGGSLSLDAPVAQTEVSLNTSEALEEFVSAMDAEITQAGAISVQDPAVQATSPRTTEVDPASLLDASFEFDSPSYNMSMGVAELEAQQLEAGMLSEDLAESPNSNISLPDEFANLSDDFKTDGISKPRPNVRPDPAPDSTSNEAPVVSLDFNLEPAAESAESRVKDIDPFAPEQIRASEASLDNSPLRLKANTQVPALERGDLKKSVKNENTASFDIDAVLSSQEFSAEALTGSELETLQRFAALKERESRERDATIQVLNKQLTHLKEKVQRSDDERRRITIQFDETRATLAAMEQTKDQLQNQIRKIDSQHAERLKALQLKLDSAQFSATRAEKKLEEFRDRVRSDILRIRLRERELANKLEIQKRDAEALLTAKDERLLAQKRELDRLEFDMDTLKERMIDETQRAEERAGKLSRALQSLKLAQGMLLGIDEEVIPTAENRPLSSDDEAA